jgi:hypothetical protein
MCPRYHPEHAPHHGHGGLVYLEIRPVHGVAEAVRFVVVRDHHALKCPLTLSRTGLLYELVSVPLGVGVEDAISDLVAGVVEGHEPNSVVF